MTRRGILWASFAAFVSAAAAFAEEKLASIRGKLSNKEGDKPFLTLPDGRRILPSGDPSTEGVLHDSRLAGFELELLGTFTGPDAFAVGPIHTRSMFALKDGRRLFITYWCDVCAIRTYTPGKCWCCQEETALDLRESV